MLVLQIKNPDWLRVVLERDSGRPCPVLSEVEWHVGEPKPQIYQPRTKDAWLSSAEARLMGSWKAERKWDDGKVELRTVQSIWVDGDEIADFFHLTHTDTHCVHGGDISGHLAKFLYDLWLNKA